MNFIRFNGLEEEVGRRQGESRTAQGITDVQALLNFVFLVHNIFAASIVIYIFHQVQRSPGYFNRMIL
jgi:hypothetical protein